MNSLTKSPQRGKTGMLLHKHNQKTYQNMVCFFPEAQLCSRRAAHRYRQKFPDSLTHSGQSEKKFLLVSPSTYIFTQMQFQAENHSISLENFVFAIYCRIFLESVLPEMQVEYIVMEEFHRCGAAKWS